jgi:hypothetical protein
VESCARQKELSVCLFQKNPNNKLMPAHILILAIESLIHGAILLVRLWIMIKLQSLNYNFLGLLGSAALASGLDMIPYFGHLLAVPVL